MLELLKTNAGDLNLGVAAVRAVLRVQDVDETLLVVCESVLHITVVKSNIIPILLTIARSR